MNESNAQLFTDAYRRYHGLLRAHSRAKLNNNALADDVVQTTFLKAWEYARRSGNIRSLRALLFHITNQLIIDEYRKRKMVSLDILEEQGFQIGHDNSERLLNAMDGKAIIALFPLLEYKYCNVLWLRYKCNLSLDEIAERTGQSKNATSVRLHRALQQLTMLTRKSPYTCSIYNAALFSTEKSEMHFVS